MPLSIRLTAFIIFLLCVITASANKADIAALKKESTEALRNKDYDRAIVIAEQILSSTKDQQAIGWAHICLGQAHMVRGNAAQSYVNLHKAELIKPDVLGDSIMASLYNGLGLYTINFEKDYYRALDYYFKGLECAHRVDYKDLYALLLNNIVGVYYLKEDATGLDYALESLRIGEELGNSMVIATSATVAAYMMLLKGEYAEALKYAQQAQAAVEDSNINFYSDVYMALGEIYAKAGDTDKAKQYFNQIINSYRTEDKSINVRAYLEYAKLLISEGKPTEALSNLEQALQLTYKIDSPLFRDDIFKSMSQCYEMSRNYSTALEYYRRYSEAKDSIFTSDSEHALQDLRAKFDVERRENMLNQQNLMILEKQNQIYMLIGIMAVVLVAIVMLILMYVRKNKLYQAIVRQNQQSLKTEEELRSLVIQLEKEKENHYETTDVEEPKEADAERTSSKYFSSSLSDEKSLEIITKLERIMTEDRPYADIEFNKEKLASMLGTNRTYLSQTINAHYEMSFSQYVNSYRLRDAMRILSNPEDDTPLKAIGINLGFSSMSTFYALFKEATGLTPNAYRSIATKGKK